jgi:hypothetical protein
MVYLGVSLVMEDSDFRCALKNHVLHSSICRVNWTRSELKRLNCTHHTS